MILFLVDADKFGELILGSHGRRCDRTLEVFLLYWGQSGSLIVGLEGVQTIFPRMGGGGFVFERSFFFYAV